MIDTEGFRENVGIILVNNNNNLFWGKRIGQDAWQFPQGGIASGESPEQAMYRELSEEIGISSEDVQLLGCTSDWLSYRLPPEYIRHYANPLCIGQKQKWFLLQLLCSDQKIRLDTTDSPEFDSWRWVDYWFPVESIVPFKQKVYQQALKELESLLFQDKTVEGAN